MITVSTWVGCTGVEMIIIGVLLFVAACVQGSIGFGLGMLAAPIIALIRPDLLPGLILLLAFGFSIATWVRERGAVEWPVVGWSLVGRVPGSMLGAWAVVALPLVGLKIVLAVAVIVGTVSSIIGWRPGHGRRNSVAAGAVGGFLGTTTAIGGPPLALIMRSMPVERVRGDTVGVFRGGQCDVDRVVGIRGRPGMGARSCGADFRAGCHCWVLAVRTGK